MAIIKTRQPPVAGPNAIDRALRDLRGSADKESLLGGASIDLSEPLPVYQLGLDQVEGSDSLSRAKHVGWRYLLEGPDGKGYADVRETSGGASKFTGLAQNPNADRLMQATHLAQAVAANHSDDVEARILEIPALYISALWLAGPSPIFIPYIDPKLSARDEFDVRVEPNFVEQLIRAADQAKGHLQTMKFQAI